MRDGEGLGGMERYYYPRHDVPSSMIVPILDVIHVVILVRIYV